MTNRLKLTPVAFILGALFLTNVQANSLADSLNTVRTAEQSTPLPEVVVTAPQMSAPLTVVTDPKAPRQPVPAHDGADYLKTIPGFSVVRKGGTDGDPVLRGMAGSRLNIATDGQQILGGCGGRMDPPTAYIFPAEYDKITVIKGPQTVLYGPGNSAGTVLFERDTRRAQPGIKSNTSIMTGSFGRHDEVASVRYSLSDFYAEAGATRSHSDDYRDGNGNSVHSSYTRWSSRAAFGWTPDDNTLLELSVAKSDGQAAYADRGMDGARFARSNIGLKFQKRNLSPMVKKVEAQIYRNYIDHVMDNYSVRSPLPGSMLKAMNPDRTTEGGRAAITLNLGDTTQLVTGFDMQRNAHTTRMGMGSNPNTVSYKNGPRVPDARFEDIGLFGELTQHMGKNENSRIITGLRTDFWRAVDERKSSANTGNVTHRNDMLRSGFTRYEQDLTTIPMTLYAGVGIVERFPDYWELISKQSANSTSAFGTKPEKTMQLDIGGLYQSGPWNVTASAFYSQVKDFILIQSNVNKGSATGISIARNIAATTWGGEIGAAYALNKDWKLDGSLNTVRGNNRTDNTPLAQMPPLEGKFGLTFDNQIWSLATMMRTVAAQKRFDLNKGNIAGQDLGASAGFTVFSVNVGWKPRKDLLITAGIDNIANKVYAEHLSRRGAVLPGYDQTARINEPGRTIWLKAQFELK
ncbi:TonB-dependent copper receptor [Glaciimonas sp. PAMC28666]|uniref:TonB-dependent copper receptor n=1 Tax=Glaciimonas sp. PAMC28666 TaxID=2807626 RepID=UPI001963D108|nr:TonB-dependent copper receptor [Glaciimonas sp. PAMC28666]QRX82580.1 TonB-dependent copper receptor [Glaciimonas sp. PAMC28666]